VDRGLDLDDVLHGQVLDFVLRLIGLVTYFLVLVSVLDKSVLKKRKTLHVLLKCYINII